MDASSLPNLIPKFSSTESRIYTYFLSLAAINVESKLGLKRKVPLDCYLWYVVEHVLMLSKIR